jgi:hypothetical protein
VNQTNGQYPDSEVYWSFDGQEESIAQQPYIDMPASSAGRMYFYLGSPNSQYYDFIEFTVGASSINVGTTRVDRFGLKLALLLHGHDGSNQEVGENYATFQESRSATFQRFENAVPAQFKELATDQAPYGIPSPGNDPAFQPGEAYANYFTSYAAAKVPGGRRRLVTPATSTPTRARTHGLGPRSRWGLRALGKTGRECRPSGPARAIGAGSTGISLSGFFA